jgi:hypothetical protein
MNSSVKTINKAFLAYSTAMLLSCVLVGSSALPPIRSGAKPSSFRT